MSQFRLQYGIRQKSTGFFLPDHRYVTKVEPMEGCWPKMYPSEDSAKRALSRWAEGKWSLSYSRDWESGVIDDVDWGPEPVPSRNKADMEVVPLQLEVVK
jgi:hypothetical protein